MAKYVGSPWGEIHGKLGEVVGLKYRGIKVLKVYKKPPIHPGSLESFMLVRSGELPWSKVSVRRLNRNMIFGALSYFASHNKRNLILPVWRRECGSRPITPVNLFIGRNLPLLYHSIPDRRRLIGGANLPDIRRLLVSYGVGEPAFWLSAEVVGCVLKLTWDPCLYSGEFCSEDPAYVVLLYWEIPDLMSWFPDNEPWKHLRSWGGVLSSVGKRGEGGATLELPVKDANHLMVYLFFKNNRGDYSISVGTRVGGTGRLL